MSPSVHPTRQRNVFTEAVLHILRSDQNCMEESAKSGECFIGDVCVVDAPVLAAINGADDDDDKG